MINTKIPDTLQKELNNWPIGWTFELHKEFYPTICPHKWLVETNTNGIYKGVCQICKNTIEFEWIFRND